MTRVPSELFWAMLGYLGLLGLVSLLVAFPTRQLSDIFNEAKHVTLSMLICSHVWVSFIPAHMHARGKDTVAVEVFAILASGADLTSCLFFLKCYFILLHPEKNTKEQTLGRHHLKREHRKWTIGSASFSRMTSLSSPPGMQPFLQAPSC